MRTVRESIEEYIGMLARRTYGRSEIGVRNGLILRKRFLVGVSDRAEGSLQALGTCFGVSKERVRQIVGVLLEKREQVPMTAKARAPLHELRERLATLVHLEADEVQASVGDLLGPDTHLAGVLEFVEQLMQEDWGFRMARVRPNSTGPIKLLRDGDARINRLVHSTVTRHVRVSGAGHLDMVVSAARLTSVAAVTRADVLRAVMALPGFEWLVPERGWFWLGREDFEKGTAGTLVRRMLFVAGARGIDADEIHAGLMREFRRQTVLEEALVPPPYVVNAIMKLLPQVEAVKRGGFRLIRNGASHHHRLGKHEHSVYAALSDLGGVASRREIAQRLGVRTNASQVSLTNTLSHSAIVKPLFDGLYMLRGAKFSGATLDRALSSGTTPME
jgi:hypothetical protein